MHQTQNSIKKSMNFEGREIIMCSENLQFLKINPWVWKSLLTPQMQWKVQAYTAISFKTHLGWFSKQKRHSSCILLLLLLFFVCLFFLCVHKFKISIKRFLSGECCWSLCKLKHSNMKKVFHKIYWNLLNLTGDAAGETYAFVYAKPPYLVMKSYAPFSKRKTHWYWFKAKMKNWNRMHIIIKWIF